MSKSLGNYVGITEAPSQMFGKLMSISDEMMWAYMDLLTDRTPAQIAQLRAQVESGAAHPKATKVALAVEIIAGFHGAKAAAHAADEFDLIYSKRQLPSQMRTYDFSEEGDVNLSRLIDGAGLASSRAEAERLIKQVRLSGTAKRS